MTEHEDKARELEREADEMEERSEKLEDEIGEARDDWERKKADPSVPGAPPDDDDVDGPETGAKYPTKRDVD